MKKTLLDVDKLVKTSFRGVELYMPQKYKDLHLTLGYEKNTIDLFTKFLKPGSVFVDVGAHVGLFSVLGGAKVGQEGKVFSFEPIPENIRALEKNLKHNGLDNTVVINKALSSSVGENTFKIREDTGLSGFYDHPLGETIKEIKVKTTTLDSHFKDQKIDLIKIDTEGNELEILKGASKTLKSNPHVKLFIELNPGALYNAKSTPEKLLEFIVNLGYEIYSIDDLKHAIYRLTNSVRNWKNKFPEHGYSNLLCIPKGRTSSVLFFSHSNDIHGAERALAELTSSLQQHDVIATVIKPPGGELTKLLDESSTPYLEASTSWWAGAAGSTNKSPVNEVFQADSHLAGHYMNLIQTLDYHFVATNTIVQPWPALAAKLLGKPHLWFIHEFPSFMNFIVPNTDLLKYIDENSVRLFVTSKALKSELSDFMRPGKIDVIYQPVSLKASKTDKKFYKNKNALRLISVGAIYPLKGQLDIIKAVHNLVQQKIDAELLVVGRVGDGDYMKEIDNYISHHKLGDKISFQDQVEDVGPLIAQSDVVVVSSQKEGFGRVVIEGMLSSKPVVATRSGGPEEIIVSGKTGFLYTPGKIEELTTILSTLAKDRALRNRIAHAATTSVHIKLAENPVEKLSDFLKDYRHVRAVYSISDLMIASVAITNTELKAADDKKLQTLQKYEKEIQEAHAQHQKYEKEIQEAHAQHQVYLQEINNLRTSLNNVITSKSWKTTKPIRFLVRVARDGLRNDKNHK